MRVVRQSSQGEDPTRARPPPGRGQAIAPTMDEFGKVLRRAGHASGEAIRTGRGQATTPPPGEDKPSPLLWTSLTTHSAGVSGFFKRMGLSRI
jgi:hypothetical protein